ncbi:TPA: hypothetical protein MNP25_002801 [Klebsiella pneumoniae]|uniref:hypothetical protein n=1 Tax=Klebsiella/Raoultella group TaxID=2890311 RepID=UPI000574B162|nr:MULTISPECIES: hypothetical protein [Klebsiella/Raoultella group]MDQ5603292.1 hypothetical protein [Klebsiella pneumoniae]HBU7486491.1 hypothetical protein [Klebsiella oxytoca]KHM28107.1 hypothetical protein KV34_17990 [Klebsiella aerogenes]HBR5316515.1 hypothetical protein [Klebsiella pneumoniae]HBV5299640.1 hypothetical protein [Klebsiella oxytoca]
MCSNVKLNELEKRIAVLVEKVLHLEQRINSLTSSQGGEIPAGMKPITTLAAEFGISTKKAEELAKNTGVMLIRLKSGGFVAPEDKFREVARQVLRSAKRKYGSAYWYHPLLGKFQMSGGVPK